MNPMNSAAQNTAATILSLSKDVPYRIASLRAYPELDAAIAALHEARKIFLYEENNGSALTAADKAGAYMAGGCPRHILYVK